MDAYARATTNGVSSFGPTRLSQRELHSIEYLSMRGPDAVQEVTIRYHLGRSETRYGLLRQ